MTCCFFEKKMLDIIMKRHTFRNSTHTHTHWAKGWWMLFLFKQSPLSPAAPLMHPHPHPHPCPTPPAGAPALIIPFNFLGPPYWLAFIFCPPTFLDPFLSQRTGSRRWAKGRCLQTDGLHSWKRVSVVEQRISSMKVSLPGHIYGPTAWQKKQRNVLFFI